MRNAKKRLNHSLHGRLYISVSQIEQARKNTEELNNTINKFILKDLCKTPHLTSYK